MRIHHVFECSNMTSVEVAYAYVQPTYLLKVGSDIRVKGDFMPQAELFVLPKWGIVRAWCPEAK